MNYILTSEVETRPVTDEHGRMVRELTGEREVKRIDGDTSVTEFEPIIQPKMRSLATKEKTIGS